MAAGDDVNFVITFDVTSINKIVALPSSTGIHTTPSESDTAPSIADTPEHIISTGHHSVCSTIRLKKIFVDRSSSPMSAVQVEVVFPEVMFGANHRSRLTLALNRSLSHHHCPSPSGPPLPKKNRKDDQSARRSKHFKTIDSTDLCDRISGPGSSPFLLLDCRSFVSYNAMHIRKAFNLNCADRINRRRLQSAKASLEDLITSRDGKDLLRDNSIRDVVIYDDSSIDIDIGAPCCHPLLLIVSCLLEINKEPILLKGGMKSFQLKYPNLCEKSSKINSENAFSVDSFPPLYPSLRSPLSSRTPCTEDLEEYPATQVLPYLYLGNEKDASDLQKLRERNIGYVLNVTTHLPGFHEESGIKYKRLPAADSGHQNLLQYFSEAVDFIDEAAAAGSAVLIHCQGGVSRSPTITIAYLMHHSRLTLVDAYTVVKNERPVISPNLNFMGQLLEYERTLSHNNKIIPTDSVKKEVD